MQWDYQTNNNTKHNSAEICSWPIAQCLPISPENYVRTPDISVRDQRIFSWATKDGIVMVLR